VLLARVRMQTAPPPPRIAGFMPLPRRQGARKPTANIPGCGVVVVEWTDDIVTRYRSTASDLYLHAVAGVMRGRSSKQFRLCLPTRRGALPGSLRGSQVANTCLFFWIGFECAHQRRAHASQYTFRHRPRHRDEVRSPPLSANFSAAA
jgi:hypothetical protein